MKDIQEQIRLLCLHYGMISAPEECLEDVEGKLALVADKTVNGEKVAPEMADLLFSLIALANSLNVDLDAEMKKLLAKSGKKPEDE